MSDLYRRIRVRREALGLSQEELAQRMGYKSRSSINKIEMGENDIPQSKIQAFARALDTTPAWLMGWEEEGLPPEKAAFASRLMAAYGQTPPSEYTDEDIEDIASFMQMVDLRRKQRKGGQDE